MKRVNQQLVSRWLRWQSGGPKWNSEKAIGADVQKKLEIAYERANHQKQRVMSGYGKGKEEVGKVYEKQNFTSAVEAAEKMVVVEEPDQPENARVLRVAVLGLSNAGKSSLVNNLIGDHVCPVSTRAYSTRRWMLGCVTASNTQILLLDTPPISPLHYINNKSSTERTIEAKRRMLTTEAAWESLYHADAVIVACDSASGAVLHRDNYDLFEGLDNRLNALNKRLPVIAVVTRSDRDSTRTRNREQKEVALQDMKEQILKSRTHFKKVVATARDTPSSYTQLRGLLTTLSQPGSWRFKKGRTTNQNLIELAENVIFEKVIKDVNTEKWMSSKYCQLKIFGWTMQRGELRIDCLVTVASDYLKRSVLTRISDISSEARAALQHLKELKGKTVLINMRIVTADRLSWQWENPYGNFKPSWTDDVDTSVLYHAQ
eukprot:TRINITY_DN1038_c0_g1_i1.p2 TRINITY_DN1038_c0_g1~~TRINITY_DN1038_c0_g1_i1.p2  ORF type:complete len:431 (+),score=81.73 TRINITY_DN1038_c0_g1_i1:5005-6297(+)